MSDLLQLIFLQILNPICGNPSSTSEYTEVILNFFLLNSHSSWLSNEMLNTVSIS